MDIDKVRGLSDAELEAALREAKQDLWQARFALSTRQLKDYSTISQTRGRRPDPESSWAALRARARRWGREA
jgi:ribosomal protein L29